MPIRLWPNDYVKKEHITSYERYLLRNAEKNFKDGHFVVDIDPVRMSDSTLKMGMYLSPSEGLVTYSLFPGDINVQLMDVYINHVQTVENKIYERLLDSKILIIRAGEYKVLKFPYKHMILFQNELTGKSKFENAQLQRLAAYASYKFFHPVDITGTIKYKKDLKIFEYIRKEYDPNFKEISDIEQKAIFERLAPEYTVVMNEMENVQVPVNRTFHSEEEMRITGDELEYRTFFLDEYQVGLVNDMGRGHRVILANPGAGKSVLLLSKAFKYASMYKDSQILLTCYNNNLADSYCFKYISVTREKSIQEQFENKIWLLFASMGFTNMNADSDFHMSYDFHDEFQRDIVLPILLMDNIVCMAIQIRNTQAPIRYLLLHLWI